MISFMLIFFLGVFAFADAFESIYFVMSIKGDIELNHADPDADFYQKYL